MDFFFFFTFRLQLLGDLVSFCRLSPALVHLCFVVASFSLFIFCLKLQSPSVSLSIFSSFCSPPSSFLTKLILVVFYDSLSLSLFVLSYILFHIFILSPSHLPFPFVPITLHSPFLLFLRVSLPLFIRRYYVTLFSPIQTTSLFCPSFAPPPSQSIRLNIPLVSNRRLDPGRFILTPWEKKESIVNGPFW